MTVKKGSRLLNKQHGGSSSGSRSSSTKDYDLIEAVRQRNIKRVQKVLKNVEDYLDEESALYIDIDRYADAISIAGQNRDESIISRIMGHFLQITDDLKESSDLDMVLLKTAVENKLQDTFEEHYTTDYGINLLLENLENLDFIKNLLDLVDKYSRYADGHNYSNPDSFRELLYRYNNSPLESSNSDLDTYTNLEDRNILKRLLDKALIHITNANYYYTIKDEINHKKIATTIKLMLDKYKKHGFIPSLPTINNISTILIRDLKQDVRNMKKINRPKLDISSSVQQRLHYISLVAKFYLGLLKKPATREKCLAQLPNFNHNAIRMLCRFGMAPALFKDKISTEKQKKAIQDAIIARNFIAKAHLNKELSKEYAKKPVTVPTSEGARELELPYDVNRDILEKTLNNGLPLGPIYDKLFLLGDFSDTGKVIVKDKEYEDFEVYFKAIIKNKVPLRSPPSSKSTFMTEKKKKYEDLAEFVRVMMMKKRMLKKSSSASSNDV